MMKKLAQILANELIKRNNPDDLKATILGKVVELDPLRVAIDNDKIILTEKKELFLSEFFYLRCQIDITKVLSNTIENFCNQAKSVTETHSQGGALCNMPNAISSLVEAIYKIRDELLALKCNLQLGDLVVLASLEHNDKYIILDRIVNV